jgi:DNA-binding transcriptional ArsR family regulator
MNAARKKSPAWTAATPGPDAAVEVIAQASRAAALLDPTRLRLVVRLAEPDSASGLARKLGLPRQRINHHLRALENAGLVEEVETRRRGNCTERLMRATAVAYVIDPAVLGAAGADPGRIPDRTSSAYLVALAARAIREVSARGDREAPVPMLSLEADVRFASAESRAAFTHELEQALASLAARYHHPDAPADRTFRLVVAGYPAPLADSGTRVDASSAPQPAAPDATGFPDPGE